MRSRSTARRKPATLPSAWPALGNSAAARSVEDLFDAPQVQAEELITTLPHPLLGSYRGLTRPIAYGRTPGPEPFAAPTLGQHSHLVPAAAASASVPPATPPTLD